MNWTMITDMQEAFDEDLLNRKGLSRESTRTDHLLAIQVELSELANEWKGFKYWSEDKTPRTFNFEEIDAHQVREYNPLLEEFADSLALIVSYGLSIGFEFEKFQRVDYIVPDDLSEHFSTLISDIFMLKSDGLNLFTPILVFKRILNSLLVLGGKLGLDDIDIEIAYVDKMIVNYQRQKEGY